jgi:hypothetical protein
MKGPSGLRKELSADRHGSGLITTIAGDIAVDSVAPAAIKVQDMAVVFARMPRAFSSPSFGLIRKFLLADLFL